MRWSMTLGVRAEDAERLLGAGIPDLAAVEDEPDRILLTIEEPDGASDAEEAELVEARIQAFVIRVNGIGRLRWGRSFEGIRVIHQETVGSDGRIVTRAYVDAATGYLSLTEFADLIESMGYERPSLPKGLEDIDGLDFQAAPELAALNPAVGRALQLVDLMLRDEDDINWSTAYAALETVETDLARLGLKGSSLGWWTKREREDFRATANSPDVLGFSARHGKPTGLTEVRMSSFDAGWFVRRVVALWIAGGYPKMNPEGAGGLD